MPHELVDDRRLNGTQVRLAAVLCRYARGKAECWPAVATLAADLELCRRSVQLNLRALERAGWIATRPAENPTGRVVLLTWRLAPRAEPCASRAQKTIPSPAQSVAPERETQTRKKPPGAMAAGPPPAVPEKPKPRPTGPMTLAEKREFYAEALALPLDPWTRRYIEDRLRAPAADPAAATCLAPAPAARRTFQGLGGPLPWQRPAALGG